MSILSIHDVSRKFGSVTALDKLSIDIEEGEIHYRKALALAEPRGMRPLIAHCHFGLGKRQLLGHERSEPPVVRPGPQRAGHDQDFRGKHRIKAETNGDA